MSNFFSDIESEQLVNKISELEQKTESEIRIHIEDVCEESAFDRAVEVFQKLGMQKTKDKTGILIYLATQDKKMAVLGDKGINEKLENNFWDSIIEKMKVKFQTQGVSSGLELGLELIGQKLIEYFPERGTPSNQLPNDISYGKV